LEYIQCSHCDKKYGVNDKIKAATGKQIRCKHCHAVFDIVIHSDHQSPEPQQHEPAASEQPPETEPETRPANATGSTDINETELRKGESDAAKTDEDQTLHEEPEKKKVNIQALISIVLGITLICASVGGYLFLNKPELFGLSGQTAPKPVIPRNLVNPMATDLPRPATSDQDSASAAKHNSAPTHQSEQSQKMCRDLSADYWIRTRLLATAKLDANTYMALLNMNLDQAQEIRKLCKQKALVAQLAEAARNNKEPQWIKTEIDARLQANKQAHTKNNQNISPLMP